MDTVIILISDCTEVIIQILRVSIFYYAVVRVNYFSLSDPPALTGVARAMGRKPLELTAWVRTTHGRWAQRGSL
jgi:hypothetical protein